MMKLGYKDGKFWLFLIIALGALLRLYKINSPILDLYPVRQEQCAMIARNFFYHGYNIFRPEVDWFGPFDSSWRLEFPLLSYITALLYSFFGIHEFLGRIVSIVFSLMSIYLVFQLTNKLFNQRTAIYASFLFAVSPLGAYFGRTFMPDTIMLFFSIASIYYFYTWIESNSKFYFVLALINAALAFLIKIPTLYLCLPLGYLAYSKYKNNLFLKPYIYLFFFLALIPSLLWYVNSSNNMITFYVANKSNLSMLLEPDFYKRLLESMMIFVVTPIGAFLALLGFVLAVDKNEGFLLHSWLLAILAYTLLASETNYVHYHYQLPFVPVFSIFAAKAIDRFSNPEIWKYTILSKVNINLAIWITMIIITATSCLTIRPCFRWNVNTYKASKAVETLTTEDAIVIAGRCAGQAPLYYTNRKGWETNEYPSGSLCYSWASTLDKYNFSERDKEGIELSNEIDLINFLKRHGANYYFTTNKQILTDEPEFRKYLYSNFKVVKEEDGFVIFDLRK